jgi:hypothetical protein
MSNDTNSGALCFAQQQVEKLAMTAIEFPPMQRGAGFNLDA